MRLTAILKHSMQLLEHGHGLCEIIDRDTAYDNIGAAIRDLLEIRGRVEILYEESC